jgi:hypothetical protein
MSTKRKSRRLPTRQHIVEIKFTGHNFSRRRINHEIEMLRARLPNKRIQVLLPYENWKPGSWFEDGQEISLFSLLDHYDESQFPEEGGGDPESYDRFIVYMTDPVALAGGCSPSRKQSFGVSHDSNDCLYQCLYHAYGTFSKLPKALEKPDILKKALGLQRNDPVPVSLIEKVELLAKTIAINVIGDETRISKSPAHRHITLTLANGHFSLVPNPDRRKTVAGTAKPKKPLIYQENGVNGTAKIYDGKSTRSVSIQELRKHQSKSVFGKWCFIPVTKNKDTGIYESLEEAYERVHEERNILLEESKKLGLAIDLFMCHGNYKKVALWLFEKLSQSIRANEPLDPIEAKWISDTMMGGIIWAKDNWEGFGRQYDGTSLYPSIMQSALQFPISKGKFQTLEDFVNSRGYNLYGLFRAIVEVRGDVRCLFRYNKHNKYTHIDLSRARELGLKVTLIQDGSPNALVYEKETRIPGTVMFGEYVHFLFKLKNIGGVIGKVAKRVLNTLWGALCQRNKSYHNISDADSMFDFPEGEILESITPMDDTHWTFRCSKPGNLFKGEYPRIAPFILAQGRKIISNYIEPYKDNVKRVHTDGFILGTEEDHVRCSASFLRNNLPHIACPENASQTLKALKFEKEGKCRVKNANQVVWL